MTAGHTSTASIATGAVPDDATLVLGVAAGDGRALAAIYDRYAGRLLGFCQNMLRRQTDAEDSLRTIFATTADRLAELCEPTMLRAWLFAVARHDCQQRLAARAQNPPADQPDLVSRPDPLDAPAGPDAAAGLNAPAGPDVPGGLNGLSETDAPNGLGGLDGLDDAPDGDESIDLFDPTSTSAGPTYADQLPLELADRQGLDPYEVAAAIGVPRTAGAPIIARAHKAARRSGGALLGEGRAFAAEMVALRTGILAAAGAVRPSSGGSGGSGGSADGWIDGWPPGDPQFADAKRRRRWGAPLAVLVVLLLALGATLGLLSASGGGHPSAHPVITDPGQSSSAAAGASVSASASGSSDGIATPTDSAPVSGIAVQPPTPSAPSSVVPTTPPSTFMVIVSTDLHPVVVSSGRAQASCPARTSCSFTVAPGAIVTIADISSGHVTLGGADAFSAPPSCTNNHGSCTFAVTSNLQIQLTTPGLRPTIG